MNTLATKTLAEMCLEHGVRRYVFASSCSIYDRGVGNADKDIIQNEETPVSPRAAYSGSKREAEKIELETARRYDLVVNTFVKFAMTQGFLNLHYGGEMWRPLVDVRDVARAYILAIQADEEKVKGQIFNVSRRNYRISELALRVREALRQAGVETEIRPDYGYKGVRSYRVSTQKIERVLGFRPKVSVGESVIDMVEKIRHHGYTDFGNPRYYNIRWMRLLEEANKVISVTGSVFDAPREGQ